MNTPKFEWYEEDSVEANNNEVVIEGGSIDGAVYGGYAGEKPGDGYVAVANENIVTISGGTVSGNVYGGYSNSGNAISNMIDSIDLMFFCMALKSPFAHTSDREGRILLPNIAVKVGTSPDTITASPEYEP